MSLLSLQQNSKPNKTLKVILPSYHETQTATTQRIWTTGGNKTSAQKETNASWMNSDPEQVFESCFRKKSKGRFIFG